MKIILFENNIRIKYSDRCYPATAPGVNTNYYFNYVRWDTLINVGRIKLERKDPKFERVIVKEKTKYTDIFLGVMRKLFELVGLDIFISRDKQTGEAIHNLSEGTSRVAYGGREIFKKIFVRLLGKEKEDGKD